jgi:hypothetical protein
MVFLADVAVWVVNHARGQAIETIVSERFLLSVKRITTREHIAGEGVVGISVVHQSGKSHFDRLSENIIGLGFGTVSYGTTQFLTHRINGI